jgi:hypothetical protein
MILILITIITKSLKNYFFQEFNYKLQGKTAEYLFHAIIIYYKDRDIIQLNLSTVEH